MVCRQRKADGKGSGAGLERCGADVQIVAIRTDKFVRYHWTEENDKSYFELRISQSELTDGTMLTVTDFAEPDDVEEAKDLWNYQIETLQRILGCV